MTVTITVLVRSATIDLNELSSLLSLDPQTFHVKGQPRVAPNNSVVGGAWPDSRWSFRWLVEKEELIDQSVRSVLQQVKPAAELISRVRAGDGDASIILRVFNTDHLGFQLLPTTLAGCADAGLDLGVEVFCIHQSTAIEKLPRI